MVGRIAKLRSEVAVLRADFFAETQKLRNQIVQLQELVLKFSDSQCLEEEHSGTKPEKQDPAEKNVHADVAVTPHDTFSSVDGFAECLQNDSVRFIKGSWLVDLYRRGHRVERRQELPAEAFWEHDDALAMMRLRDEVDHKFLFALSYRWLYPLHPDPHRHHLGLVCKILTLAMKDCGDVALFWDFLSLPQRDDDGKRTLDEERSFRDGLKASNIIYAHRLSVVLMQTQMPTGFVGPTYEDEWLVPLRICGQRHHQALGPAIDHPHEQW